jgi:hypothetical protein
MPRVIQPGGGVGKMRVCYTAHRNRGLVAVYKRMQAEGMTFHAAAEELRVSIANLSKSALQGIGKIDHLDKILRSKKKAALTGPVSQFLSSSSHCATLLSSNCAG